LKNSNLCDHNSPTSQTDRQTDRQTTCDRNTALCTKVHRAVMTWLQLATVCQCCYHSDSRLQFICKLAKSVQLYTLHK